MPTQNELDIMNFIRKMPAPKRKAKLEAEISVNESMGMILGRKGGYNGCVTLRLVQEIGKVRGTDRGDVAGFLKDIAAAKFIQHA